MDLDINVIDTLTKVVTGMVGVFVGRYLTKRKEKISLAFDFHKELNNTEMSRHRHTAGEFIRLYPTTNIEELERMDKEKSLCIYVIMRFYQRLWMSIKYKQIETKVAKELFSANFYYWYYVFFEKNAIPIGWWSTEQIKDLATWFAKSLPRDKHEMLKKKYEETRRTRINEMKRNDAGGEFLGLLY